MSKFKHTNKWIASIILKKFAEQEKLKLLQLLKHNTVNQSKFDIRTWIVSLQ